MMTTSQLDSLGYSFMRTGHGFVDFLPLNEKGYSLAVLEAKAEDKSPLLDNEQLGKYAKSQDFRPIILSKRILPFSSNTIEADLTIQLFDHFL